MHHVVRSIEVEQGVLCRGAGRRKGVGGGHLGYLGVFSAAIMKV